MPPEVLTFVLAAVLSMLGGFAYLHRTKETIRFKDYVSSALNTGLCGLALAMIWYTQFQDQIYILIGFCIFVGLMGPAGVEWVLEKIKKGNISISFNKGTLEVKNDDKQITKDNK